MKVSLRREGSVMAEISRYALTTFKWGSDFLSSLARSSEMFHKPMSNPTIRISDRCS